MPKGEETNGKKVEVINLGNERHKGGLVYIEGTINEKKVNIWCDTGASHSFIDKSFCGDNWKKGKK